MLVVLGMGTRFAVPKWLSGRPTVTVLSSDCLRGLRDLLGC